MEDLVRSQSDDALQMEKIRTNFRKDPATRKTEEYYKSRLEKLNVRWETFDERNDKVEKYRTKEPQSRYFTEEFYQNVEKMFTDTREELERGLQKVELSTKIKRQMALIESCCRALKRVDSEMESIATPAYCSQKIKLFDDYWTSIVRNHCEIMAMPQFDDDYFKLDVFSNTEDLHQKTIIKIQEKMNTFNEAVLPSAELSPSPTLSLPNKRTAVKLPTIEIPSFNGDPLKWQSFRDLFTELIFNNTSITPAEKLFYLKGNLSGEPSDLIRHLQVTSDNLSAAWSILDRRYDNKRTILTALLRTLLNQPNLTRESAEVLKKLHDRTVESLEAIKNLGINTDQWDPILIFILSQKLDKDTLRLYEQSLKAPRDIQTLKDLLEFIENRFLALQTTAPSNHNSISKTPSKETRSTGSYTGTINKHCPICKGTHRIYICEKFKNLCSQERFAATKRAKLCSNCLVAGHYRQNCRSTKTCFTCHKKHHTLLHYEPSKQNPDSRPRSEVADKTPNNAYVQVSTHITEENTSLQVLIPTAIIRVVDKIGNQHELRALVDQGSQATFITEDSVQRLRLHRDRINTTITGIGGSNAGTVKASVQITITSRFESDFSIVTTALIMKTLTRLLPSEKVNPPCNWKNNRNLRLADPEFEVPRKIDIILGADIYSQIVIGNILRDSTNHLLAQATKLGWLISGGVYGERSGVTCHIAETDIQWDMQKFWECEDIPNQNITTDEDIACENHFLLTHRRDSDGRYIVRIPFRETPEQAQDRELGSRNLALARLFQMEGKFKKNKSFEIMYKDFMREYLRLGHMLPADDDAEKGFYLPHHAVLKQESTTTKLRVVFDASAKRSNTRSLNQLMLIGPQTQQGLYEILLRWRKHRFVFIADVEKMYRQIKVDVRDQDYQRILWRESTNDEISAYKLTTVTYGMAAAPFLATRTLQQLAKDDYKKFPVASEILQNDTYVDDIVSGQNTLDDAAEAVKQLRSLLKGAGFNLRKWASNDKRILKTIPNEDREASTSLDFCEDKTIKALGVHWRPSTDAFTIKVSITTDSEPTTKRHALSEAARVYDPIGLLAPITMKIKLLFQDIWATGLSWDDKLPDNLLKRWKLIKMELPRLEKIEIPRWINYTNSLAKYELHGFSDASEKGYGAAIYLRAINEFEITTALITAKTKVSPLKNKLTIPRLELCGAVLLANLMKDTVAALDISDLPIYAWTDSLVVLGWLQEDPHKWHQFVGNRVAQIQSMIDKAKWFYVKSKDNPADIASRGLRPSSLETMQIWWEGPSWLRDPTIYFPHYEGGQVHMERKTTTSHVASSERQTTELIQHSIIYELIKTHHEKLDKLRSQGIYFPHLGDKVSNIETIYSHVTSTDDLPTDSTENPLIVKLIKTFSELWKLQQVVAYVLRFITNTKSNDSKTTGRLTTDELDKSLILLVKVIQNIHFPDEIKTLRQHEKLKEGNRLYQLYPFIDHAGVLRVGGRLQAMDAPFERKHPAILPYKSELTNLIIDKAHLDTLHGGNSLTLERIRQQFWILSGLKAVKGHIHQCVPCSRYKAKMSQQMMGMLPKVRITQARPFSNCGVDYAGPFELLMARGRGHKTQKGYVSLFICLATKAVHLEVVTALSAEAFIAAFRRFVARRGPVANIYSDNGTNFVGANKILREERSSEEYNKEIFGLLQNMGATWHFIPPASPHFGGLWEAGVKSMKHHLRRVIGENRFTYEEMCTLMTQIEACLNSRPLCPLSEDPESLDVLTPGHFLIGSPLLTLPCKIPLDKFDKNISVLKIWQRIERLKQDFWRKWSSEYLSRLQQRPKWINQQPNVEVGNLVLIKDEQLPPARWALGRIIEVHPGPDGLVRVVTLKTKGSTIKRPITKISLLPIIDNKRNDLPDFAKDPQMLNNASTSKQSSVLTVTTTQSDRKRHLVSSSSKTESNEAARKFPRSNPFTLSQPWLGIIMIFLLMASALGDQTKLPYHINKFDRQEGIYFEAISNVQLYSSEWNMIIYYDLNNYWRELFGIRKTVKNLAELCEGKMNISGYCQPLIYQLKHQLIESEDMNTLLYQQNEETGLRYKRAPLEIIGSIARGLFGILDQEFADNYQNQIINIGENEEVLRQLLRNQTSILENTLNFIKKDTATIDSQIETLTNQINKIGNHIEGDGRARMFLSVVLLTSMHLNAYQRIQRSLLSVIADTKHGRINTLFLNPEQLNNQLKIVRENLPHGLTIPGESSTLNIYNMMHIRLRVLPKYVLFDVRIPLLSTDTYHLYKLIPIPMQRGDKYIFITPSSKYLLINGHRDRFTRLSEDELRDCTHLTIDQLICNLKHPVYNLRSNESRCELDIINLRKMSPFCDLKTAPATKLWIKLHLSLSWIFILNEEVRIEIFCKDSIHSLSLNGSGTLQLDDGCGVKQSTMFISPSIQSTQKLNLSFIPDEAVISTHIDQQLNFQKTSDVPPMSLDPISTKDMEKLQSTIDEHKFQLQNIPKLHRINTHHFIAIYSLAAIGILWALYKFLSRQRSVLVIPQPAPRTSVPESIQPLPTFS